MKIEGVRNTKFFVQVFDLVIRGIQRICSSLKVLLAGNWKVKAVGGKKALLGKTKINEAHGRPFAYLLHRGRCVCWKES